MCGQINQIGATVGGHYDLRIRYIQNPARAADESIAGNRVLEHVWQLLSSGRIHGLKDFLLLWTIDLAVGIEEWKPQFMSEIDCEKAYRQKSCVDLLPALGVFIDRLRGIARRRVARGVDIILADRRKAVIRRQKNISVRG